MVVAKRKFLKKLKDEFDKQESKRLLNGIKALNQNNLKNEEEGIEMDEGEGQLDQSIAAKKEDAKEAFQNFVALPTDKTLQRSKIFGGIFSVYRQQLQVD